MLKKGKIENPYPMDFQSFSPYQTNFYRPTLDYMNPSQVYTPSTSYELSQPLTKTTQVATLYRTQYYGGSLNFSNIPIFAYSEQKNSTLTILDIATVNYMLTGDSFADKSIIEVMETFRLIGVGESYNYGDYDKGNYRPMRTFDSTIISYVPDGRTHIRNHWYGTILAGSHIGFLLKKVDVTGLEYELSKEVRRTSQSIGMAYQFIPEVSESPISFIPLFGKKPDEGHFIALALVKETYKSILQEPNSTISFLKYGTGTIDTFVDMNYSNIVIDD